MNLLRRVPKAIIDDKHEYICPKTSQFKPGEAVRFDSFNKSSVSITLGNGIKKNISVLPPVIIVADEEAPFNNENRLVVIRIPKLSAQLAIQEDPAGHVRTKRINLVSKKGIWGPKTGEQVAHCGSGGSAISLEKPFKLEDQLQTPQLIGADKGLNYWVFRNAVYSTTEHLKPEEVKALLTESENKVKARIARAIALAQQVGIIEKTGRQPIPDDVKVFVWQRDRGRCVRCEGQANLEFDHIIPVVMGGGGTARNLPLLCETCNRAKGGSLI